MDTNTPTTDRHKAVHTAEGHCRLDNNIDTAYEFAGELETALRELRAIATHFNSLNCCTVAHHAEADRHGALDPCPVVARLHSALSKATEVLTPIPESNEPSSWLD